MGEDHVDHDTTVIARIEDGCDFALDFVVGCFKLAKRGLSFQTYWARAKGMLRKSSGNDGRDVEHGVVPRTPLRQLPME